jgi:hypothetical protein
MSVKKPWKYPDEVEQYDIEQFILKGAKVKADSTPKKKVTFINLRVPASMLEKIDEELAKTVGISRTGWILQAIQDKLNKE